MNRFETFALGLAGAALAVGFVGPVKLVVAGLATAVLSYVGRKFLLPRLL